MKIDLKDIFDESITSFIIVREDGLVLFYNKKAEEFLSLLAIKRQENFLFKLEEHSSDLTKDRLVSGPVICSFSRKDDKDLHFEITTYTKQIDGEGCYVLNIADVTKHKNAVLDSEIYKTIFNSVASTIVITDLKGNIEMVNPAFEKFTGYTVEEARGQNPKILNSGYHSAQFFRNLWATLKRGEVWRGVFKDVIKSGEFIWEKSIISPIRNEDGEIEKYVAIKENITKEKAQELELKKFSYQDYLTGLANRRKFEEYTENFVKVAKENDIYMYCLMIDIDNFKIVNDSYGHEKGDDVLVAIAETLMLNVRGDDIASRHGGEEFVVILTKYNYEQALARANKIREDIAKLEFFSGDNKFSVTVSMGFCKHEDTMSISEWLKESDKSLYEAKHTGKNKVCEKI